MWHIRKARLFSVQGPTIAEVNENMLVFLVAYLLYIFSETDLFCTSPRHSQTYPSHGIHIVQFPVIYLLNTIGNQLVLYADDTNMFGYTAPSRNILSIIYNVNSPIGIFPPGDAAFGALCF